MKTFQIHTLGCKVNQYESRQIGQWLASRGLCCAGQNQPADLILINTCCVTRIASSKSRQLIRKARKKNPAAIVVAAGCLPAGPADELKNLSDNIITVHGKEQLPDLLSTLVVHNSKLNPCLTSKPINSRQIKHKNIPDRQDSKFSDPFGILTEYSGQTRAFLKIQDGCDARCTYCIIPKIRKNLSSKPLDLILQEAQALVDAGHPEIVLTGIFIGAWGRDTARRSRWPDRNDPLPELLDHLARIPGLVRLRMSSLEPADLTDEMIEVYRKHPNIAPHLHLPLQSGSSRILRRMARQYTADEFLCICEKLQAALDRPAITTDVIVGFPGETEADFEKTLDVCRRVQFAKIHVFPYSPRKGTSATRLPDPVPQEIIRQRAQTLHQLDKELQQKFRSRFIGEKVRVILESTSPPRGRCDRYFMVDCSPLPNPRKAKVVEVILKS